MACALAPGKVGAQCLRWLRSGSQSRGDRLPACPRQRQFAFHLYRGIDHHFDLGKVCVSNARTLACLSPGCGALAEAQALSPCRVGGQQQPCAPRRAARHSGELGRGCRRHGPTGVARRVLRPLPLWIEADQIPRAAWRPPGSAAGQRPARRWRPPVCSVSAATAGSRRTRSVPGSPAARHSAGAWARGNRATPWSGSTTAAGSAAGASPVPHQHGSVGREVGLGESEKSELGIDARHRWPLLSGSCEGAVVASRGPHTRRIQGAVRQRRTWHGRAKCSRGPGSSTRWSSSRPSGDGTQALVAPQGQLCRQSATRCHDSGFWRRYDGTRSPARPAEGQQRGMATPPRARWPSGGQVAVVRPSRCAPAARRSEKRCS